MSEVTPESADPSADAALSTTDTALTRLWYRGLAAHLAVYLGLLVVLLAVGVMDSSFTSDEGAYYLQVELIDEGRWDLDYPLAQVDPDGTYFPIINSDIVDRQFFPYVKHPLYVYMLDASIDLLGNGVGGHLWSILGALGAAAAAWYLAAAFDSRLARLAFWLAALGPPLANSQMVWAHTLSAAVGGFAALVCVKIVADHRFGAGRAVTLSALLVFGVLLRTEGLLWAAALLAVLGMVALRSRRRTWLFGLAVSGGAALVAFAAQRAWRLAIVGGSVPSVPDSSAASASGWVGDRVRGGIDILVKGAELDPAAATVVALSVICVALAGLCWRAGRPQAESFVLVTVAVVLYVVRFTFFDADPIAGVFSAWPIVLLALVVARRELFGVPATILGAATAVFTVLVVLSQWGEAGGVQWGGRYLSPAVPVVAALAALSLRGQPDAVDKAATRRARQRAFPAPLIAALLLVPAAVSVVVPEQLRAFHTELVDDATRSGSQVVISGQGSLPRFAWASHDDTDWYLLGDEGTLGDLLGQLEQIGVEEISTVSIDVDEEDLGDWQVVEERGDVAELARR